MLSVVPGTCIHRNWPLMTKSGMSAPQIDIGTETRMTKGSRRLSNCAASTRKITMMAKTKVTTSWLPSWTYCRDSERKSWKKPLGSDCAWLSRKATAWPMLTPGIGTAEKVAELSWLYWVSELGCVEVWTDTTAETGI